MMRVTVAICAACWSKPQQGQWVEHLTAVLGAGLQDTSVSSIQRRACRTALAHSQLLLSCRAAGLGRQRMLLTNTQAWCGPSEEMLMLLALLSPVKTDAAAGAMG